MNVIDAISDSVYVCIAVGIILWCIPFAVYFFFVHLLIKHGIRPSGQDLWEASQGLYYNYGRNIDFSARDNSWSSPDLSTSSVPHQSDHWGTNLVNDVIRDVTGADIKTGEYHG